MLVMENNFFIINDTKLQFSKIKKKKISISSYPKNYNIYFDDKIKNIRQEILKNKNYCIVDKNIYTKYPKIFKNIPKNKILLIIALEKNKNYTSIKKILNFFIKRDISKSDTIICIGGGILQDLCGYACCTYKRGINWVYYPTTLLGMTDSCMGGKVGVNYNGYKNLIALFVAPVKVVINFNFIQTLSKNDLFSGLGEALRLHVTGGVFFYRKYSQNFFGCLNNDLKSINEIIFFSLMVKKSVVEKDEYEKDIRRAMNFGHSFGHAFEYISKNEIPHGICVVIGMCVEILVGLKMGLIKNKEMINEIIDKSIPLINQKTIKILKKTSMKNINNALQKDKKTLNNKIFLSLPYHYGRIKFYPIALNKSTPILFEKCKKQLINIINEKNNPG